MADLTLDLLSGGLPHLCGIAYSGHTIGVNEKRIADGKVPLDRFTTEQIWRTVCVWYFSRHNPLDPKKKTQKSLSNCIRQIHTQAKRLDKHYEEIKGHLPTEIKYSIPIDLSQIAIYLESQIPNSPKEGQPNFWSKHYTPVYSKREDPILQLTYSINRTGLKDEKPRQRKADPMLEILGRMEGINVEGSEEEEMEEEGEMDIEPSGEKRKRERDGNEDCDNKKMKI